MNEDEIINIVNVIIDKINISPNIPITIVYEQDDDEETEDDAFIVEC